MRDETDRDKFALTLGKVCGTRLHEVKNNKEGPRELNTKVARQAWQEGQPPQDTPHLQRSYLRYVPVFALCERRTAILSEAG